MAITATSYGLNHDAAFTGMVADGQVANIVSKINDDTATVAYGKGVVRSGEKVLRLQQPHPPLMTSWAYWSVN